MDGWDAKTEAFTGAAAVARRIFGDYLAGTSTTSISEKLSNEGIPSPLGNSRWRPSTVARILDNPAYAGTYRYGMSTLRIGEKRRQLDGPTYEVDGAIPVLISQDEFERVRRLREDRLSMSPRAIGSVYLLSGLARCGKCGQPINGKQGSDKRYYSCLGRLILKTCDCALMGPPALEVALLEQVKERLSGGNVRQHVRTIEENIKADIAGKEHAVAALEAELAAMEKRLAKVEDDYFKGDLDGRTYGKLLERVEADQARAQERLEAARRALRRPGRPRSMCVTWRPLAERIDAWESLSPESLKQVLQDVIDVVYIFQPKSDAPKGKKNPHEIDMQPRFRTNVEVSGVEGAAS